MNNRPTFTPDQTIDQTQYYWFENGFSKEEIEQIVKKSAQYTSKDGTIIGSQEETAEAVRKSKIKWLPNNSEWSWVYDKLAAMAVEANNTLWKFDLYSIIDDIQFTEYEAGGGHYDWHVDIGPSTISHRKVSIVVQLADPEDYEGGDLELQPGNHSFAVPKKAGAVVLFPSFMLHRVTPVTSGLRRSLVLWVGGSHFK
jgi:PKHD-type hydroxylase